MEKKQKAGTLAQKINIIRASVMGANDGILSVAGIVLGVAGATTNSFAIFISGISGMLAGTVSMAMGEYVSVNSQKDSQENAVNVQRQALKDDYQKELDFVAEKYANDGIPTDLAQKAASEMMEKDALLTTVRERYGFDMNNFTSPYMAAISSMISFSLGSLLPLFTITFAKHSIRVPLTVISVAIALAVTGYAAAVIGKAVRRRAVLRNVLAGLITMAMTYLIGSLFAR
ncbi:VIT1/CCC1 transporter family protein [Pediococcus pentosaceus]|jgi:VIT1/CCC1 family predicted Fe2+/Mn2+ transporter|uniref:VIT family protein n=1 Tax=Pediococcus pentosaceus TaxID=1255 RepID=A0A6L5A2G2_PEDPE|nr:VIT family protein [Pediococcus pentosaceus]AHA04315.1 membrane protein [Pediococcus pentosaceus SL4]KAF0351563.1 VIT family protein [Pediococcus pentosaceus]KAF0413919.1 VIT family protein [Pediococcus pentosaceus]KAF0503328.1 VIT family protein [Pediococcus pentosaceus]KAF0523764.1 VIT family protein [Pediococcus pentosaceus]